MLDCDDYLVPRSLDEAFELMDRHAGAYRIVAGATDLLPWAREGRAGDVHYPVLIDVSRVPEMSGWTLEGGRVRIGANTTFAAFLAEPFLAEHVPVMRRVAVWFADDQIREQATLGGNLINASPAADGTPPMIAMNATVRLERRAGGERRVREMPLAAFVTGPAKTRLDQGELLTAITCDALPGHGTSFQKVGHRRSLVISIVCVAALVKPDRSGTRFDDVRLALGAVGPVPVRLDECETFLKGKPIADRFIREAAMLPVSRVASRTRRAYRREVVFHFVRRAVVEALADAGVAVAPEDEAPVGEVRYG